MIRAAVLFGVLAHAALSAEWKLQFFHDQNKQKLVLNDIRMLTAQRGLAVGFLEDKGHVKPMSAVTSNGGKQWKMQPLPDEGISLYFLDDSTGWMVAESGIWFTEEGGRGWKRVLRQKGLERVLFTTRERGFAVGRGKTVLETRNSGKTWSRVAAAKAPESNEKITTYNWVTFANAKVGLIAGYVQPRRTTDPEYPIWMDPYPGMRPEWPSITIFLVSQDGGDSWKPATSSLFGHVTRFTVLDRNRALVLFRYDHSFRYPSELVMQDRASQKSHTLFRDKNRLITDFHIAADGTVYIGGIEVAGSLGSLPIPGKVKIHRSRDLSNWEEMDVDYRASATRVVFTEAPGGNLCIATDTGMILSLVP